LPVRGAPNVKRVLCAVSKQVKRDAQLLTVFSRRERSLVRTIHPRPRISLPATYHGLAKTTTISLVRKARVG